MTTPYDVIADVIDAWCQEEYARYTDILDKVLEPFMENTVKERSLEET